MEEKIRKKNNQLSCWKRQQSFLGRQGRITRRRVWLLALNILYQFFIYPVGMALVIGARNADYSVSEMQAQAYRQSSVVEYLGMRQPFWWIPLIMGVITAMAEFSFLFSMVKMDFYESQPVSRSRRFGDLWINGVLLFTIPQWIFGLLGILVAAGMDAMTGAILGECVLVLLVNTVDFLAAYSIAVLACTLCGNGIVAVCLAGFFLLAEPVWKVLVNQMASSYFVTYTAQRSGRAFYFTPVINAVAIFTRQFGSNQSYSLSSYSTQMETGVIVYTSGATSFGGISGGDAWPYFIANIVIAVAAALLARVSFMKRKSESAGASILYAPLREVVKVLIAATAALMSGYLVNTVARSSSTYQRAEGAGAFLTVLVMVIVGIIAAGAMQCIYEFNMRAFFHEWWSMLLSVLLGVVALSMFTFDLAGYNRYVPREDDVAWGAISFYQSRTAYDNSQIRASASGEQYLADNMHLTGSQLESLLNVARQGQQYLVESAEDSGNGTYNGYYATVTYHLNSGQVKSRNMLIPYDVDRKVMDDIVSSREYKSTVYPVYSNGTIMDAYAGKGKLVYTNGLLQKSGQGDLYEQFKEAYWKDLEQYSYTLASTKLPIGYVGFLYYADPDDNGGYMNDIDHSVHYIDAYFEVYEEYTNTLAFLRENDLYLKPISEDISDIATITVTNYQDNTVPQAVYTAPADEEQIKAIMVSCRNDGMTPHWYPADEAYDYNYSIDIEISPKAEEHAQISDEFGSNFYFTSGHVPDFVITDVGGSMQEDSEKYGTAG